MTALPLDRPVIIKGGLPSSASQDLYNFIYIYTNIFNDSGQVMQASEFYFFVNGS